MAYAPVAAHEDESLQRRAALASQRALVVQLYTALCPGRGGEYWGLQFAASPTQTPSAERPNLLVVCPVNGALLRLSQHKTSRGVEELPLPGSHFDSVIAGILSYRSVLLQGKAHSYAFCRASDGSPFASSGRWSQFLQETFARGWAATRVSTELDVSDAAQAAPKISVNSLRKSFVTAVHGDATVTPAQKESVARAMRHTEGMARCGH